MVADMAADMEVHMVADMEVDKVAVMVADKEADMVVDNKYDIDINININMEIQLGERVGHVSWLIGPKLFQPEAYLTCVSSISFASLLDIERSSG